LITSRGRIKFTFFAVWQSFIFCKVNRLQILPVRVCKSRAYVLARFARVALASFKCELDTTTASILRPQTPEPAFCHQIRANIAALRFSALISRREI